MTSTTGRRITDTNLTDEELFEAVVEAAETISVELDGGRTGSTVTLIDPGQAHRYRRSVDGHLDLENLDADLTDMREGS